MADQPKYRPLITVATGIASQIEACLEALDKHKDLPPEADELGKKLADAHGVARSIVIQGEKEPEPEE